VWVIGAILQDLHRREVDNLWNFSLIAIALSYRAGVSVFNFEPWFFINGLIGFGIFLILGNIFYYARLFAGGDTKLLIALGAILPLSYNWIVNFKIFGWFILLSFVGGSIYVLCWSIALVFLNWNNFKKEYFKQFKFYKSIFLISFIFVLVWIVLSLIFFNELAFMGLVFLLFPVLFIFAKSVEECCMVKKISPDQLTEGDWLYEDVFVNGKKIKSHWEGVSGAELKLISEKYRRKLLVKYGVPFTPAFLIGLLGIVWFSWKLGFF
jgi:hypothetical protein